MLVLLNISFKYGQQVEREREIDRSVTILCDPAHMM